VYEHLTNDDHGPKFKRVWKAKITEKIKTLMWLLEQRAILTKDNMSVRNWQGVLHAISMILLLIIYFLNALLQKLYGVL
jgi:hypothetical protein